jgi:hypothetical protein
VEGWQANSSLPFAQFAPSTRSAARGNSACEKPAQIHSFAEPRAAPYVFREVKAEVPLAL